MFKEVCSAVGINPAQVPERVETPLAKEVFTQPPPPPPGQDSVVQPSPRLSGTNLALIVGGILIAAILAFFIFGGSISPITPSTQNSPDLVPTTDMSELVPPAETFPLTSPTSPPTVGSQTPPSPTETTEPPSSSPTNTPVLLVSTPSATPEPPKLILDNNHFCRGGPGTEYPELWTFLAGDELEILGWNGDNWWLVKIVDIRTRKIKCWIGGGTPIGDTSKVPISNWTGDGYGP